MKLNPGIIKFVKWLTENGFNAQDSGDGETHDLAKKEREKWNS